MFTGMQCADRNLARLLGISLDEKCVLMRLHEVYNKKRCISQSRKLTTLQIGESCCFALFTVFLF